MNCCSDLFRAMVVLVLPMLARGCIWGSYEDCQGWSSCSRSCGGGETSRICESCFWRLDDLQYDTCNTFCYNGGSFLNGRCECPAWRSGYCCETCINVIIKNCLSGEQVCGGAPDGVKCTQCASGYTPGDYGLGCLECNGTNVSYCLPGYKECNGSAEGIRCITCEQGYMPGGYGNGCQECAGIAVKHCLPGYKNCSGSAEGIRCNMCEQGYMPGGYGNGCQECAGIAVKNCLPEYTECNGSAEGIRCNKCEHGYKPGGYGNGCKLDEHSGGGLPGYGVAIVVVGVFLVFVVVVFIVWKFK